MAKMPPTRSVEAPFLMLVLVLTIEPTIGIASSIECTGDNIATYNGICLPVAFPPRQNYSRDVQHPPYLRRPPPLINITVGRQLFVDDFLVENMSSTIRQTFHTAEYYEGNPVLVPDQPWEVNPISTHLPSTKSTIHVSINVYVYQNLSTHRATYHRSICWSIHL